jgi:hypothetical protein
MVVPFGYFPSDVQAQAKTPQQRRANQLYEKRESSKRGKPLAETRKPEVKKPPISKYWIGIIAKNYC